MSVVSQQLGPLDHSNNTHGQDFDDTPAPSAQPSRSTLREAWPIKLHASPQTEVPTDIENNGSIAGRSTHSHVPSNSSGSLLNSSGVIPPISKSEPMFVDLAIPPTQVSTATPHPGLLRSVDRSDSGEPVNSARHATFEPLPRNPNNESLRLNVAQQTFLNSELPIAKITAPSTRGYGHSTTPKVRPARIETINEIPSPSATSYASNTARLQSKVMPFAITPKQLNTSPYGVIGDLSRLPPSSHGISKLHSCESHLPGKASCSRASFSTLGSHPGHHHFAGGVVYKKPPVHHSISGHEKLPFRKDADVHSVIEDPSEQEINPEPSQDLLHRPSGCDVVPVYSGCNEHSIARCIMVPSTNGIDVHHISNCEKYPTNISRPRHELLTCSPMKLDINDGVYHGLAQCETCPSHFASDLHSISQCSSQNNGKLRQDLQHQGANSLPVPTQLSEFNIVSSENLHTSETAPATSHSTLRRTSEWLNELLGPSRSPRLTEHPSLASLKRGISTRGRRPSEPTIPTPSTSQTLSQKSFVPSSLSPIDKMGFQRVVCDLEKLLGEALNIASQASIAVEDSSLIPSKDQPQQRLIDKKDQDNTTKDMCMGNPPLGDSTRTTRQNNAIIPSQLPPQLPAHKFQSISSSDKRRLSFKWRPRVKFYIPVRNSSKQTENLQAVGPYQASMSHHLPERPKRRQLEFQDDDLTSEPTEIIDFQPKINLTHSPTPVQNAQRFQKITLRDNVSGNRLYVDHGISLRRKSHVSLDGDQGLNLVKSHRRRPIARD